MTILSSCASPSNDSVVCSAPEPVVVLPSATKKISYELNFVWAITWLTVPAEKVKDPDSPTLRLQPPTIQVPRFAPAVAFFIWVGVTVMCGNPSPLPPGSLSTVAQ